MRNSKTLRHGLIVLFIVTNATYLSWRFSSTLPLKDGWISLLFGLALVLAEFSGAVENVIFYLSLWNPKEVKTPLVEDSEAWPSVDIYIATYNEPMDLLYKTINGCTHLDYPDPSKVTIYLCDDGHRQSAKDLADQFGIQYLSRPDNAHAKAGNLNYALAHSTGDLVVTFDADMIPRHEFLLKTVPFFMKDPQMGFVQTPQAFYNPDTFQYNLFMENSTPNEQDLFFSLVQSSRSQYNAIIYAGSNTVLSRKALNAIGNFVTGTITEDFATGMRLQSHGFKSVYLNEVLANGLSPETLVDVYNQRVRWANGVLQSILQSNPFFEKGLDYKQKWLYWATISYWFFGIRRIIFIISPIVFVTFGFVVLRAQLWSVLAFWVPMFLINHFTFRYFSKGIRSSSFSNVYETILAPQIAWNLLKQMVGISIKKFKVTPKEHIQHASFVRRYDLIWTQLVLLLFTLISLGKLALMATQGLSLEIYSINIFWLVFNLYLLTLTVFYANERPILRDSVRFTLPIPLTIQHKGLEIQFETHDLSESGFCFYLDTPLVLDANQQYAVHFNHSDYPCDLTAHLVRISQINSTYLYAFKIHELDETHKRHYLQLLYDRIPPVPRLHEAKTPLNILWTIVTGQRNRYVSINRTQIRLVVNRLISVYSEGKRMSLFCKDFNFDYLALIPTTSIPETVELQVEGRSVMAHLDNELTQKRTRVDVNVMYYKMESTLGVETELLSFFRDVSSSVISKLETQENEV